MSDTLQRLALIIESRKIANGGDPEKSYVARLFSKGDDAILKKIGEEATETVMAAKDARVDRSRSRDTGGTGLGLAIVKHVVQRHGGQLRIDSVVGQGSTFRILLPASRIRSVDVPVAGAISA